MENLQSLSDITDVEEFSFAFRNFLDDFYAEPSAAPLSLPPRSTDNVRNAYLAATGDYLCNRYNLRRPGWLSYGPEGIEFVADPPFFASKNIKTRVLLLAESPTEFRRRHIFVSADALSRA